MWKIKIEIEVNANLHGMTELTKMEKEVRKAINSVKGLTVKKLSYDTE